MYRSDWDFEQHARHTERQALAAAEHARKIAVARCAPGSRRGFGIGARLRSAGSRLEGWVSGTAPRRPALPAHCPERIA